MTDRKEQNVAEAMSDILMYNKRVQSCKLCLITDKSDNETERQIFLMWRDALDRSIQRLTDALR
jgi:hypothetical protein